MTGTARHPLLQWLVYGHLWLALAAAVQVWYIGLFLQEAPDLDRYMLAVALGTFAGYGAMRWMRSRAPALAGAAPMMWVKDRGGPFMWMIAATCVMALLLLWPLLPRVLPWLLPAALMAALYVTPFSARNGIGIGLRNVPVVKFLVVAVAWTLVVVAGPMACDLADHSRISILLAMCMRLPLFMSLAIAFDIRDAASDHPGLRTLPQLFGVRGARLLSLLLMVVAAVYEHLFLRGLDYHVASWTVLVAYAFALFLIGRARSDSGVAYYGILLDGTLILIPLCTVIGMRL
jgi:hypothetical protein